MSALHKILASELGFAGTFARHSWRSTEQSRLASWVLSLLCSTTDVARAQPSWRTRVQIKDSRVLRLNRLRVRFCICLQGNLPVMSFLGHDVLGLILCCIRCICLLCSAAGQCGL